MNKEEKGYSQKYYQVNKDKIKKQKKEYYQNKYITNPNFKILENLRNRIRKSITNNIKSNHTQELLGCSIKELKEYLERQFTEGMSWDNWGFGNNKWHIDHIKPCSSFNMSNEEEQRICFNYKNLQPLWQRDNLAKGNKLNWKKK